MDEDEEEAEQEDLEDTSLLPQSSSQVDVTRQGGKREVERIEVEHHVVYSGSYNVPMLCLRAWDSHGAPLPLSRLISSHVISPNSQILQDTTTSTTTTREDVILLDPHSPFPLLQQTEHPSNGEVVWSFHPCQVGLAVEEILAAEDEEMERKAKRDQEKGGGKDGGSAMEEEEKGVRWLEVWMMLSSGIADLVYP